MHAIALTKPLSAAALAELAASSEAATEQYEIAQRATQNATKAAGHDFFVFIFIFFLSSARSSDSESNPLFVILIANESKCRVVGSSEIGATKAPRTQLAGISVISVV